MARIVAFNVGAATSNSTTSSENDIQTLPLGIFTLPLSLIVIIARFIPTILQIFHKLYSQTLIYRVRVWCLLPVGSANNAFPLYSGRFSFTCPRTVLTRLHVYGSPSVTSSYLTHLWIFALHSAHTTKVFLCM